MLPHVAVVRRKELSLTKQKNPNRRHPYTGGFRTQNLSRSGTADLRLTGAAIGNISNILPNKIVTEGHTRTHKYLYLFRS
jgi:hypothetical protein